MDLVIVESPAKAKTINKYLGHNYKVIASFGHVRDLSAKDGSVIPEQDFAMHWEITGSSAKHVMEISKAVKNCDAIILATDPDREGEAISWHVLEILQQKNLLKKHPIKRVAFNAITKQAVLDAMAHPRQINTALVNAYLARRALDYLFGFTLSPILWRKLPGARSAGRVQSVALKLVCMRESEIEQFISQAYWSIAVELTTEKKERILARLISYNHKKLSKLDINSQAQADVIEQMLAGAKFYVQEVAQKEVKRAPAPPFTTSTLQQAASAQLGFSPSYTMQLAQKLYEGIEVRGESTGLITYMRTDSVHMAQEAVSQVRTIIEKKYGPAYLPSKSRTYTSKVRNAQEAHEAIRPTSFLKDPESLEGFLEKDMARLYGLIWRRAAASQMADALIDRTTIDIEAKNLTCASQSDSTEEQTALLRTVGSCLKFEGFLAAYNEQNDDENTTLLPLVKTATVLDREKILVQEHHTEPPPRYTEASLIKKLEELGIGRPSTYASTLATLRDRQYIIVDKRKIVPEVKGRFVTTFLQNFFEKYIEYDFTAKLEDKLDLISDGQLAWKDVLSQFWDDFNGHIQEIKDLRISNVIDVLNNDLAALAFPVTKDGEISRSCPECKEGELSIKIGRYGAFIGCSNYPSCGYTKQLGAQAKEAPQASSIQNRILGQDPDSGESILLCTGRYGPYVQKGEEKGGKKAALPKGWVPQDVSLSQALALLALPREIGVHPETQAPITTNIGRYGPFLFYEGKYFSLPAVDDVFSIGLNRAVSLIEEKKLQGNSEKNNQTAILKTLGEHPDGGDITIKDGKYGPYINWKKVNIPVKSPHSVDSITLELAMQLLAQRPLSTKKKRT